MRIKWDGGWCAVDTCRSLLALPFPAWLPAPSCLTPAALAFLTVRSLEPDVGWAPITSSARPSLRPSGCVRFLGPLEQMTTNRVA